MKKIQLKLPPMSYAMTEELKTLRTNMLLCGEDKKVILVTSSLSGEGKTGISTRLASSLAEVNKKVLLIDTDLRKSVMNKRIAQEKVEQGVTHYLAGQCSLADILCTTDIPGLHIMFAGTQAPNPTELLTSEKFKDMLEATRPAYDYIIMDAPPLGMVIDAAIIAEECDGAVIVVQSGTVRRKLVQSVKEKLDATSCPVLGVVLNKIDRQKNGYYYGRYYGKYYGKRYEKYYGSGEKKEK